MSITRASWTGLLLQLVVMTLLLARQSACRKFDSDTSETWPTMFGRILQQRDSSAVCAVQTNLTVTCNTNCRVCVFNRNVAPASRTCKCCKPGFFSTSYTTPGTLCTQCPVGQIQPAAGATTCRPCPRATTTIGTQRINCDGCPPGTYALDVQSASGATVKRCSVCPRNQISSGGVFAAVQECSQCPAGTTTTNNVVCNVNSFPRNARCANVLGGSPTTPFVCATGFNTTRPSNDLEGQTLSAAFGICCTEDATLTFPEGATCQDISGASAGTQFICGTSYTASGGGSIAGSSPSAALEICCTPKP